MDDQGARIWELLLRARDLEAVAEEVRAQIRRIVAEERKLASS
jgi:hypothetical protein